MDSMQKSYIMLADVNLIDLRQVNKRTKLFHRELEPRS